MDADKKKTAAKLICLVSVNPRSSAANTGSFRNFNS
jgi:hypothetical protein